MRNIFTLHVWVRGDEVGCEIGWVWIAIFALLLWWLL